MIFLRKLTLLLCLTILLIQCKNDSSQTVIGSPTETEQEPQNQSDYLHLIGTVKDIPVTMNLFKSLAPNSSVESPIYKYSGSYYYDQYMEPIEISDLTEDTSDLISLVEWSADETTNQFIGKFNSSNTFEGDWQNGYRKYSLPVNLEEKYPIGTVDLDYFSWQDFQPADTSDSDETGLTMAMSLLWPKDGNSFIKDEILKIIDWPESNSNPLSPKTIFEDSKKEIIEDYSLMVEDFKADSIPAPNYGYDDKMYVIWNEDSLLVLGYSSYSYEGGAHGNFGKKHYNLNLRTKSLLTLDDLFMPGYETKIANALEKALRRKYDLRPNDDIHEVIDVDEVPLTDNFFITGGGIGFYYPPYELGPWAAGDFEFFVRYEDIEDLLKPELIDRF